MNLPAHNSDLAVATMLVEQFEMCRASMVSTTRMLGTCRYLHVAAIAISNRARMSRQVKKMRMYVPQRVNRS
jgi:hypothetical protein